MSIRAFWTGNLSFGLVSIPVKLYLSASDERVSFNFISPEGNRVKQQYTDEVSGKVVDRDKLLKGYEHSKGQFVTFTSRELEVLELRNTKTVEIREFVPADSLDIIQVEKTYFIGPDKGGDKAYVLLRDTLMATGKIAIAQWTNKGREHLVAIRPYQGGLVMHVLFYANEVRDFGDIKLADVSTSEAERNLAAKLVDSLSTDEVDLTKYEDRHAKAILDVVATKVAGREVKIPEEPSGAGALDLLLALKQSLEGAPTQKGSKKTKK